MKSPNLQSPNELQRLNYMTGYQHSSPGMATRGWFNINMPSYQYSKSHCGHKTILRPSYLHNRISNTGKKTFYIESGPWVTHPIVCVYLALTVCDICINRVAVRSCRPVGGQWGKSHTRLYLLSKHLLQNKHRRERVNFPCWIINAKLTHFRTENCFLMNNFSYRWDNARKTELQCVSNGVTYFPH